jgi:hypothetical protein
VPRWRLFAAPQRTGEGHHFPCATLVPEIVNSLDMLRSAAEHVLKPWLLLHAPEEQCIAVSQLGTVCILLWSSMWLVFGHYELDYAQRAGMDFLGSLVLLLGCW